MRNFRGLLRFCWYTYLDLGVLAGLVNKAA